MAIKFVVMHLVILVLACKVMGSAIDAKEKLIDEKSLSTIKTDIDGRNMTDVPEVTTIIDDVTTVHTNTTLPPNTTITPPTTTVHPNTTTAPTTTTTVPTTTLTPNTTAAPNTTTVAPTTVHPNVTTISPNVTTVGPTKLPTTETPHTTEVPTPRGRRFDGPSFFGGIILSCGSLAIGFVSWKFYKARTERNYHTL